MTGPELFRANLIDLAMRRADAAQLRASEAIARDRVKCFFADAERWRLCQMAAVKLDAATWDAVWVELPKHPDGPHYYLAAEVALYVLRAVTREGMCGPQMDLDQVARFCDAMALLIEDTMATVAHEQYEWSQNM